MKRRRGVSAVFFWPMVVFSITKPMETESFQFHVNFYPCWVSMPGTKRGRAASKALKASIEGGIQVDIQ
jgi:hypothetical protein